MTRFNSGTGADTRTDIQKAAMAVEMLIKDLDIFKIRLELL